MPNKKWGREITAYTTEIQGIKGIITEYLKLWYINKVDNLEEVDKFLETYSLPRWI